MPLRRNCPKCEEMVPTPELEHFGMCYSCWDDLCYKQEQADAQAYEDSLNSDPHYTEPYPPEL